MGPGEPDNVKIWGAITALSNLVEALWVTLAAEDEDPVRALQSVRDKMLLEFDLPPRDTPQSEGHYLASLHAVSFLEEFWRRAEDRARHHTTP